MSSAKLSSPALGQDSREPRIRRADMWNCKCMVPMEGAKDSMSEALPVLYIARHGNTAWTHSGQHTGLTDLPLTPDGERNAVRLGERLKGMKFAQVFTSPLQR